MNTTIHEMTLANCKKSKTQQEERRKRNTRKIIKIVNGQLQKKYKGSNAPESLLMETMSLQECQRREA